MNGPAREALLLLTFTIVGALWLGAFETSGIAGIAVTVIAGLATMCATVLFRPRGRR